ncbi:MAG: hypothetical protein N2044_03505 [Cyclobacteriaceae bacterium]|nr:hypothetical protein [Cyclobacteriaceae bacterium]
MRLLPIIGFTLSTLFAQAQKHIVKLTLYEIGRFDSTGKPVGIWNYFDEPGEVSLVVNYDNGALLYQKVKSSTQEIFLSDKWVITNVQRPARYLGSLNDLIYHYHKNVSMFLARELEINDQLKKIHEEIFWLSFEVDTHGRAANPTVNSLYGNNTAIIDRIFLNGFETAPALWIPALHKGVEVPVRFTIPFYYCRKGDCKINSIPQTESITPYGQILFSMPVSRRGPYEAAFPKMLQLKSSGNKLGWSPDGQYVLFQHAFTPSSYLNYVFTHQMPALMYRLDQSGRVINGFLLTSQSNIVCASNDCSDFLFQSLNAVTPWLGYYNNKFSSISYAKSYYLHHPVPRYDKPVVTVGKLNPGNNLQILEWNWQTNTLSEPYPELVHAIPITWINEKKLLVQQMNPFGETHNLVLFDEGTKKADMLPFIDAYIFDISKDKRHLIIARSDPYSKTFVKLFRINLETLAEERITKDYMDIQTAFFGESEDEIFYLLGFDVKKLDLRTNKSKKVLSGVSMPSINPQRTDIVYIDQKSKSIYKFTIATSLKKKFFDPPKEIFFNQ